MTEKQKPTIHNMIIDVDGKCEGLTEYQIGTLDATYHMLEDLCVSAHSLTLLKDFMPRLSKQERDEIMSASEKITDMLPHKNVKLSFIIMHILYVNTYANLFDSGLSAMFNQIKMDREGVMFGMKRTQMEEEKTDKKPLGKPPESVEVA